MSMVTVGSRVPRDRTILIAGMGISPAVLTEPVRALASGGVIYSQKASVQDVRILRLLWW